MEYAVTSTVDISFKLSAALLLEEQT